MYQEFFGLRQSPFGVNPDPRFLFRTRETEGALAALTHGTQNRLGFILLTGEAGTGKTTLLNKLLYGLRCQQVSTAFVSNSSLNVNEFLDFIMADFGIECESSMKSRVLMRLNEWLLERHAMEKTAVLVVDEAQDLSFSVLEEICMLTNLETHTQKLLQIVLSGQPELGEKIREPRLRQLRQRIGLHVKTRALTLEETRGYVTERLRIAGACGQTIFTPEAVERVHKFSGGIPRLINLLCEHALITAYAYERRPVGGEMIEEVARQLEVGLTQSAAKLSACDLSRGGERQDANAVPPPVPTITATGSFGLAMSKSMANDPHQLHQVWDGSREGTNENHREARRKVGPPAREPYSGILSRPSARLSAATDQEPGVAPDAVRRPRITSPPPDDKPNAKGIGTGPSFGRAAADGIGRKPMLPAPSFAAGRASQSVKPPSLRRISGTRIGWVGLTLVLSALIGSWLVMQMVSEVHSQSTTEVSTQPVATPSRLSENSPPATSTASTDDVRVSSALDKMFPPAPTISPRPVSTHTRREAVKAMSPSRVPRADRGLSPAQRDELKDKIVIAGFFMDRNDYDAAIEAFDEALKIDPSSPEARVGIQSARRARDAQKTTARP